LKERGAVVSQVVSENVSPSALAVRTLIRKLESPAGSCRIAICDLPGPLKVPLAATLEPKAPTDRTSVRGRGVGLGDGLGVGAKAALGDGSGAGDGNSEHEAAVSAASDRASRLIAAFKRRRMVTHGYQVPRLRG
jgi:hypothetical protein